AHLEQEAVGGAHPTIMRPNESSAPAVSSTGEPAHALEQGACSVGTAEHSDRRPKFDNDNGFLLEVRRRVDTYFETTGRRRRDCLQMYVKTAVIFAWLLGSYALLFVATAWWQALLVALPLGLAMAAVGLNIQHDGAHHAY